MVERSIKAKSLERTALRRMARSSRSAMGAGRGMRIIVDRQLLISIGAKEFISIRLTPGGLYGREL